VNKEEYFNILNNERSHFYYRSTKRLVLYLLKDYLKKNSKILDAGCGTGYLSEELSKLAQVFAIDIAPIAVNLVRKRGIKALKGSVERIPFADRKFDIVVCIDVLYHRSVKNDQRAIKELLRVVKDGGILLVKVPAFEFLKTSHDRFVGGGKRYMKSTLSRKLELAGGEILKISYFGFSLFIPLLLRKLWEYLFPPQKPASLIRKVPKFINSTLELILFLETVCLGWVGLPLGISLIAIVRKK